MVGFKTFMDLAMKEAVLSSQEDEVPVGAVIVKGNNVIAINRNRNITLQDPTAHAEILAIRDACRILKNNRLFDCDIYVTLEPCAMCAAAIAEARIKNLYYSLSDKKYGAVENNIKLFTQKNCHHKINIYNDLGDKDAYRLLLKRFFQEKR